MNWAHLRLRATEYLRNQQLADGSFMGYASSKLQPFQATRRQATIFPTMLILDALHDVADADDISKRAAQAVLTQVSSEGSWNYWRRESRSHHTEPYPDDLDDTACAIAALMRQDPAYADGNRLGSLARLLIAVEHNSGGPYNTWLIDYHDKPDWQDVDLAVNANISYALSIAGVRPAGLQRYLETAILTENYQSSYYLGIYPLLYFLSRGYHGPASSQLRQAIAATAAVPPTESLPLALLLTAGCRSGVAAKTLQPLARSLLATGDVDHWPATPLYADPIYNKQLHYNGSSALSTALALEALTAFESYGLDEVISRAVPAVDSLTRLTLAPGYLQGIDNRQLRRAYRTALNAIMTSGNGKQIAAAATLIVDAGGWTIPKSVVNNLNLASLNGWLAYTIYDDFLDGEGRPERLPVANLSLRRSYDHFLQALPQVPNFRKLVITAFDDMDSANSWELKSARAVVKDGVVYIKNIPDYGSLDQLAQRSWGHSLAASGVVLSVCNDPNQACFIALQTFFKHFLIARQLNDDAHDWEADLRAGRLSVVVTWLLQDAGISRQVHLSSDITTLRQCFWEVTIGRVVEHMRQHNILARSCIESIRPYFKDVSVFQGWLDALERSAELAINGRDDTVRFLQAYRVSV